ncbi:MAG: hypothetical protein KBF17_13635, partial [Candidatus Promineofilum sp.]|nr:hypothetical protein [Promineifilum sp.]
ISGVLPSAPWAPLKLLPLLTATLFALYINKRREPPGSLLSEVAGSIRPALLPLLFILPAVAVGVYAAATTLAPPVEAIYVITAYGGVMGTAVLGGLAFLVALVWTVASRPSKGDADKNGLC